MVSDLLDFIHHPSVSSSPNFQSHGKSRLIRTEFSEGLDVNFPTPRNQVDDEGVLFDKLPRARVRLPLVPQMFSGSFCVVRNHLKNVDEIWSESCQKSPKMSIFLKEIIFFIDAILTLSECVQTWCAGNNAYGILPNFCHLCRRLSSILIVSVLLSSCSSVWEGLGLERETVRELSARAGLNSVKQRQTLRGFWFAWDIGHWYGIFWIVQIYPNIAVATYPARSWMPMRGRDIMARWCQLKVPDDTTLVD